MGVRHIYSLAGAEPRPRFCGVVDPQPQHAGTDADYLATDPAVVEVDLLTQAGVIEDFGQRAADAGIALGASGAGEQSLVSSRMSPRCKTRLCSVWGSSLRCVESFIP